MGGDRCIPLKRGRKPDPTRTHIRLPESARPGFSRQSPEEQAGARERDAKRLVAHIEAFARERGLEARAVAERIAAEVYAELGRQDALIEILEERVRTLERRLASISSGKADRASLKALSAEFALWRARELQRRSGGRMARPGG